MLHEGLPFGELDDLKESLDIPMARLADLSGDYPGKRFSTILDRFGTVLSSGRAVRS